jgi:hypothetical protein
VDISSPRRPLLCALLALLVVLAAGCDEGPPTAEALCLRASKCPQMDVLISTESCTQQVEAKVGKSLDDCSRCVLSLPCSGMARVASGKLGLSQLCGSCQDELAQASCPPRHDHLLVCGLSLATASASGAAKAAPPAPVAPAAHASASASASASAPASARAASSGH